MGVRVLFWGEGVSRTWGYAKTSPSSDQDKWLFWGQRQGCRGRCPGPKKQEDLCRIQGRYNGQEGPGWSIVVYQKLTFAKGLGELTKFEKSLGRMREPQLILPLAISDRLIRLKVFVVRSLVGHYSTIWKEFDMADRWSDVHVKEFILWKNLLASHSEDMVYA